MQKHNENNTISLFIFRSSARGMQYGIGTYIHELTNALLIHSEINIFLISYNSSDMPEFTIKTASSGFIEAIIPRPLFHFAHNSRSEKRYADSVVKLLSNLVPKTGQVIFQFNYIDDLPIIKLIKESYDYPCISIVHFAQWQQIFEGNKAKLTNLNLDNPKNNIEFTLSQEREMYRQSDHIISVTRYMKDFLVNEYGISSEKITVIKNGLTQINNNQVSEKETTEIRRRFGFGEHEIILLFSGRIDACKGINYLMEAFEQACIKNNSLRLVMLGQGSIQDCQKRIQSCFGKVTYTGFLPRETVTEFYKIADIGIVPSVYDHCPYSVLEMMANRIPLIMSRINGLDELLSDDECLFINPIISDEGDIAFNVEEMSELILSLASNKDLRARLAENSYGTFKRRFTSASMGEEMRNLFYSLLKQRKPEVKYETSQGR
ncbi:MAG: glycosyltransferase [Bacteroidales bacterium]|jgi:glycosyltransferase involved in cell wall biosynthesis